MSVKNKEVMKAQAVGNEFKVTWSDSKWLTLDLLQASPELAALDKTASEKFSASRSSKKKGAGEAQ